MLELPAHFEVHEITNQVFNVKQINSIVSKYPGLRQKSKAPTFALTFQGTWHTLVNSVGFSKAEAVEIEERYHALYIASDLWVQNRIKEAHKDGYSTAAFGLRIRTPLLKQVIYGAPRTPYEAAAEARTLGNAISGQSYGLLNNRAACAFMARVRKSKHRLDIKLVALVHDAIYLMIKDDIEVVEWVNNALIEEMRWQELPELQHPTVKLGAALDIFWPTWANAITIPNGADQATIRKLCLEGKEEYLNPKPK